MENVVTEDNISVTHRRKCNSGGSCGGTMVTTQDLLRSAIDFNEQNWDQTFSASDKF